MELSGQLLITGGSGFLGRGLLRRIAKEGWDCGVTIYSRDEYKQDLCKRQYPDARYVLGDIRDISRLEPIMYGHRYVIHAAALKYVPEAEYNAAECVAVNVDGSRTVIMAALSAGVEQVIGISTDKAVMPVNIYGASKMIMERLFADVGSGHDTQFKTVRYGNVVGSTGSVLNVFEHQRDTKGRLMVTEPTMTRFWMSVDEAIDTILMAIHNAGPGTVTIPRPSAMSIMGLAEIVAGDLPIDVIGPRPGEKMHEELIHIQESTRVTSMGERHFQLLPIKSKVSGGFEPFNLSSYDAPVVSEGRMTDMILDSYGLNHPTVGRG